MTQKPYIPIHSSHKYYYDYLPMEIFQECWKFKAYQETRSAQLVEKRNLILAQQRTTKKRKLEELRLKPENRWFCDRQKLKNLKEKESHSESLVLACAVGDPQSYRIHLHNSWKKWLFYHIPIYFPKKKKNSSYIKHKT